MELCLTSAQEGAFPSWLRSSGWLYNHCLEQRIKAYKRRGENVSHRRQCSLLRLLRERMPSIRSVSVEFARDALRCVDRGMKAFFRRVKSGDKRGFPRLRSHTRYNSLEHLKTGSYVRPGNQRHIPKRGFARFRAAKQAIPGK